MSYSLGSLEQESLVAADTATASVLTKQLDGGGHDSSSLMQKGGKLLCALKPTDLQALILSSTGDSHPLFVSGDCVGQCVLALLPQIFGVVGVCLS